MRLIRIMDQKKVAQRSRENVSAGTTGWRQESTSDQVVLVPNHMGIQFYFPQVVYQQKGKHLKKSSKFKQGLLDGTGVEKLKCGAQAVLE